MNSESWGLLESGGGQPTLLHCPWGKQAYLFGHGQLPPGLPLLVGHRGSYVLQGRPDLSLPDLERSGQGGGDVIFLLILQDGIVLLKVQVDPEFLDRVAHDVKGFVLLPVIFSDALETTGKLNEELGAECLWTLGFEELGDFVGRVAVGECLAGLGAALWRGEAVILGVVVLHQAVNTIQSI